MTPAKDGAREESKVAFSLGHPGAQLVSGYLPSRRQSLARFTPNGHRHILEATAEPQPVYHCSIRYPER